MRFAWFHSLLLILTAGLLTAPGIAADEGYLRHPDIHGDKVVFVAERDLWLASSSGGTARRLTSHVGNEFHPKFSPDGRHIAFTGLYDGNPDIFVVSAEGGEPRRLTWHPALDEVIGWSPDGERILFRSTREEPHGSDELYAIPAAGGEPEKLPLGWASRIDIDPESGMWAFTRTNRENRTWKRYRGGTATDIWVGDPEKADFRKVTDFAGMNAFPMWHGGRIYFLGDRGGTANLWSMTPDGDDRTQHTSFDRWDARFPSIGDGGRIIFMFAGDLHLFDPADGSERKLEIDMPSDRVLTRTRYPDAARYLTWFDLSPDGERVAITARGEIFSVPVKKGVTLPVTRGSGARESWAAFGHEGKRLFYITDEPREEEIHSMDAWGRSEPQVIKKAGKSGWHFPPSPSPDGKWLAYADQTQKLYIIPAEGGKPKVVASSPKAEIRQYAWSPDSRWLAYSEMESNYFTSIFIYDLEEEQTHRVTRKDTNDRSPAWDPEGRYLYFLSDRYINPLFGFYDFNNVNIRPTRPYLALLRKDVENPFLEMAGVPPAEEPEEKKEGEKEEPKEENAEGDDKKNGDEAKPVEIDFDGLAERIAAFPVDPGIYGALGATKSKVFYLSTPLKGMAEGPALFAEAAPDASLISFDLESKKVKPFTQGVSGYDIALQADKIAVMKRRGELYVLGAGAPPGPDLSDSKVALEGLVIELDPIEEWAQIYHESWRLMRDFYWDAGMAGVDWKGARDQYAKLLPRLATRDDLRDLVGEMIGEMSTSHTYVFGGDPAVSVPRVPTGLLGADVVREGGALRVARIYRGGAPDNERSPLLEPGVGIGVGDYILAVNNRPFSQDRPFLASFEGLAGKRVMLTVNDVPDTEGSRTAVVVPLGSEGPLRYADWVRRNREYVHEKTGGKIGYIHIPDMLPPGLIEFNSWFYTQLDREGMVVDARWNGGGAFSEIMLERLRRPVVSFSRARGGRVDKYPVISLNGPFVVLTNEFAGSDGDMFPAAVQLEGLAPVIGARSWGGVVGIRIDKRMVDGGFLTRPEFAWWDPKDGWGLENRGVLPDIEVQNKPQELARGIDAQLNRAIEEVLRLHEEQPPIEPQFGPARPRGREDYRKEGS